jgi:hypothetical protein
MQNKSDVRSGKGKNTPCGNCFIIPWNGLKCTHTKKKGSAGGRWMNACAAATHYHFSTPPALFFTSGKTNSSLSPFGTLINNKKCARSLLAKLICVRRKIRKSYFLSTSDTYISSPRASLFVGIDFDRKTRPPFPRHIL